MTDYEVYELATRLMSKHNLFGWKFKFTGEVRTLGRCYYSTKEIGYSKHFLHLPYEEIKDVLLHEIAHVLAGPSAGHGTLWKIKAREVGARPERCYQGEHKASKQPKQYLYCKNCGKTRAIFRKPKYTKSCGNCCPRYYNENYKLEIVTSIPNQPIGV